MVFDELRVSCHLSETFVDTALPAAASSCSRYQKRAKINFRYSISDIEENVLKLTFS